MKKLALFFLMVLGVIAIAGLAFADPQDEDGGKDHPLLNRMPNYYISDYQEWDFDQYEFVGEKGRPTTIEGRRYRIEYFIKNDFPSASGVQIHRNYTNAVKSIGGQVVHQYENFTTLKVIKNDAEVWIQVGVYDDGNLYDLHIIERQAMNQDVVADAANLAQAIKSTGKVALYGIYFDTGKAELKPESDPSLAEIAKLLKNDSKLNLYVVGHTDSVGKLDANMKLSKDRADAVAQALVGKHGVAAARLQAFGAGPLAPVASNENEEGRKLNRRVELVKQ